MSEQRRHKHRWLVASHLGHLLPTREAPCLDCGQRFGDGRATTDRPNPGIPENASSMRVAGWPRFRLWGRNQ